MRATASLRAASLSGPAAGLRGRAPALARSALAAAAPLAHCSRPNAYASVRCAAAAGNADAGAGSGGGSDSVGSAPDKLGPAPIATAAVAQAIAKAQLDALLASRAEGEFLRRQLGEQQRLCAELQALVGEQRRLSGEQLAERLGALAEQMGGVAEKLQGHESRVSELLAEWGSRAGLERDLKAQLQASEAEVASLRQQLGEQQAAMEGELDRARAQIAEAEAARDGQAAELGQAQAQVEELQRELERLRKAGPAKPEQRDATKPTAAPAGPAAKATAAKAPPARAAATAPTVFEAATQAAAKGAADAVVQLMLDNLHTQELLDPESYFVVAEEVPPSNPKTLAAATPSLAVWLLENDGLGKEPVEALPGGVLKHSGARSLWSGEAAAVSPRLAKHARAAVLGALVPLLGEGMGAEWLTDCKLVNRQTPSLGRTTTPPWARDPAVAASMPVLKVTSPPSPVPGAAVPSARSPWAAAEAARQAEAQKAAEDAAELAARRLHSSDTSYLVFGLAFSRFLDVERLEGRHGDGMAFKSDSWYPDKSYERLLGSSRAALLGAVQAILGDGATAQWLTGCEVRARDETLTNMPVMAVTHTDAPEPQAGSWGADVKARRQASLRSAAGTILDLLARHLFTAEEAYLVFEDRDWDLEDLLAESGLRVFLLSGVDASSVASGLRSVGATPSDTCNWFPSSESLCLLERSREALLEELRSLLGEGITPEWVTLDLDIDWSRNKFDRYDYVPDEKRVKRFACRGVPVLRAQLDALLSSRAEGESLRRQLGEQQRLCAELQALVGEQRRLSGEQLAERLGALAEQLGGVAEKLQGHESRVLELLAEWGARAGLERGLKAQLQASEAEVASLRQQLGEQQAAMEGELDRARAQITEAQAARDAQAAAELGQAQAQAQVVELQRELESLRKAGPSQAKPTAAKAPPAPAAATAPTVWADRSALAAFEAATQAAAKGAADAVVELLLRNIHTQELLDAESYFVVMEEVPPSEPRSKTLAAATPSLAVWLLADDDVAPQLVEAVPGGVLKHSGAEQASTARARRDNKHPPAAVSPRLAKHARAAVLGALVPLLGEGMGAEWLTDCKLVNRCTWQDPFPWALDPAVAASMPVLKAQPVPGAAVPAARSPWAAAEAARQAEAQNVAKVAAQLAARRLHSTDTSYLVFGLAFSRFLDVERLEGRLGDGLAFKSYSWSLGKDYGRLLDSSRAALLGAVQAILGDGATAQWLTGCQLHRSELHGVITDVPVMAVTHTNTPDPQAGSWGAGVQARRQAELQSAASTIMGLLARHLFTAEEAYLVFEDRDWDLEDRYAEPGLRVFLLSGVDASSVASGGLRSVGAGE
ncbi:hypothetical protein HYH03_013299 [Edaphochlamys debaryana]|uniref:Uncharacterized protein n=1 Tax=Edaphochlamys debaryana TaxID=47281 RepID=A0A836BT41_9CHLO|nr:hypothetical protein HYH03_013299 [Edaphochlamys debaryana]|eukprot:KAG2488156.1 hypothetical protein HYH03_013299 [Edaphochlamys debaryana]